jgi:myosin-5
MQGSQLHSVGSKIWLRCESEGWIRGQVVRFDDTNDKVIVSMDDGSEHALDENDVPLQNPGERGVEDMITLTYLNEPGVLWNLRVRYEQDDIYTYTGPILIAVNPFTPMPHLYGAPMMEQYKLADHQGELSPHVYAIADASYKQMRINRKSQAILVSGESGAGKTETSKHIMQYLVESSPLENDQNIEKKILESNPLLEAFGNAKTVRNDNSSRFGKFTEIQFASNGSISGAAIKTYLLERSRVVSVSDPERNYHIFYQVCDGATSEEREAWNLKEPRHFQYLSTSSSFELEGTKNAEEYVRTRNAMDIVGIPLETQECVFKAIAAVLHLGNVTFESIDDDECKVSTVGEEALGDAARLLGIPADGLRIILTTRTRITPDGKIVSPISFDAAVNTRDSFAKTLYSRTFDWLVECINKSIGQDSNPASVIGVLDIYGFEEFKRNDFEQFCINFANEKLQQHFNQHVFKMEQKEYEEEGIEWSYIEFVDNQDVLDVIEGCGVQRARHAGILDMLDESCKFPRFTSGDFAQKLFSSEFITGSSRFSKPKLSQEEFIIQHYAGKVQYDTSNFLEKNKDFVVLEHQELLRQSSEAFVRGLFPVDEKDSSKMRSSYKFNSVSSRFSKQLSDLMSSLHQMEPHYIRCIKPNKSNVPMEFENSGVLQQLRCGGVLEAVRISCAGYPSKRTYPEFCDHFWMMCPDYSGIDDKSMTEKIIEKHLSHKDTQFGKSRVFLRAGRMAELEKKRMELQNDSATIIQAYVKSWIARNYFKEVITSVLRIQCNWRGFLACRERTRRQRENAALWIQSAYRSYSARKQFKCIIDAVRVIQRSYKAYLQHRILVAERRERAAILIQSSWRSYVVRKGYIGMVRVVILIQSLWRARLARAEVAQRRIASRESGKLIQDKENLEKKVHQLQELSETLMNQRNDLRKQLKQVKAERVEVESLLRNELAEASQTVAKLEQKVTSMAERSASDMNALDIQLLKVHEQYKIEKIALSQELDASKTLVTSHETKLKELEAHVQEVEHAAKTRISQLESEVDAAISQRDKAMEDAQIAAGQNGTQTSHSGHLLAQNRSSIDYRNHPLQKSTSPRSRENGSDLDRKQREILAKQQQLLREQRVADQERLISTLKVDLGFQRENPIAAVVIFRSFIHWKANQQENGAIFERVSDVIGMEIQTFQEDSGRLGYWFTNTAALYYLMKRHTQPAGSGGENGITARLRQSGQQAAKGFLSYIGISPKKLGSDAGILPDSTVQFEARFPALLFKQKLGALTQRIFAEIRDNFKRDISEHLSLCMNSSSGHRVKNSPWNEIVDVLDNLLAIVKRNHVPHLLVAKLFEQLFTIMNVFLFNQIMLRRDCCSFSNGEYAKLGIHEVEKWTTSAGKDWVGESWNNLSHLRQAVTFLVIHQKAKKSLDEILKDLCPSLLPQQIYRLGTMYWDDRFNTASMNHEVLSQLKVLMNSEPGQHTQSFLLNEDTTVPFSTDDLGTLYDGKNLLNTLEASNMEQLASCLLGDDRKGSLDYLVRPFHGSSFTVIPPNLSE